MHKYAIRRSHWLENVKFLLLHKLYKAWIMRKLSMDELQRISPQEFKNQEKTPLTLVLDNIRSLSNVGSVFRTSDAFLVKEIILCGITATPPHKEIQKTALGATESVEWRYEKNTKEAVEQLQREGVKVFAIEQADNKEWLQNFHIEAQQEIAIVLGNEVKGVDDEVMLQVDGCIEIPQYGTKHSLNISIAAGIVIWELFQKLRPKT
jgi:23S rRNA (guanosine2251-2'-O)-methyltransferase